MLVMDYRTLWANFILDSVSGLVQFNQKTLPKRNRRRQEIRTQITLIMLCQVVRSIPYCFWMSVVQIWSSTQLKTHKKKKFDQLTRWLAATFWKNFGKAVIKMLTLSSDFLMING